MANATKLISSDSTASNNNEIQASGKNTGDISIDLTGFEEPVVSDFDRSRNNPFFLFRSLMMMNSYR